jgi:hypothetical protein
MESSYLCRLPGHVQELVTKIESFASMAIEVAVDTRPVSDTDPNPDRLAAEVTERNATILLRAPESFPSEAVTHALLHIERYWNGRIPQIVPVADQTGSRFTITSAIENTLEHLVIVPRQERFGVDPYPYWARTSRENWSRYPWPTMTSSDARRRNCLLGWLTAKYLTMDEALQADVRACLRQERLLGEAERFSEKIMRTISTKPPHALSAVVRFLKIPEREVIGVLFDAKARRRIEFARPRY